jgi:hypothetical protein
MMSNLLVQPQFLILLFFCIGDEISNLLKMLLGAASNTVQQPNPFAFGLFVCFSCQREEHKTIVLVS